MVQSFIFCNHSRILYYFWILIFFLVFWAFWSHYWSPIINERQPLGRLEKLLLENLSEIIINDQRFFPRKFLEKIILFLWIFGAALSCRTLCKCLLKVVLNNTSQMSYFGLFTTDLPSVGNNGGTHIAWFNPKGDSNCLYLPLLRWKDGT